MKAIGYIRFSRDEQAEGNSIERQTANIEAYCQRTGLTIAEMLVDEGYSAFKGEHLSKGKLGRFLAEADKGKYRGYALLVEATDRLSRLGISETGEILRRLMKDGVEVHITSENRIIKDADDLMTAIMNAVGSYSAQEYSRKLRERVGKAWSAKKRDAANGKVMTAMTPAWLQVKDGRITVIPERKKVVKLIFQMAASGMGKRLIARRLNERGIAGWGRKPNGWRDSYVGKILNSRTVLGEFQPHKYTTNGRIPEGEPVQGYYPAVITEAEWLAVHGNGVPKPKAGRVGRMSNLFPGLTFDADLKRPMGFEDKGRGRRYLCSDSERLGIHPHRINYDRFESNFLQFLDQLDWTTVLDISDSSEIKQTEELIAKLTFEISRLQEQVQKVIDLLVDMPSPALKERLQKAEAQIVEKETSRKEQEAKLEELRQKHRDLLDTSIAYQELSQTKNFETRARLRQEIRRKVSRIDLYFDNIRFTADSVEGPGFNINFYPDAGPALEPGPIALISFVNGAKRVILFEKDQTFIIVLEPKKA